MKRNKKIKLLFTVLLLVISSNAFSQDNLTKTYDSERVIDSLINIGHKVTQAIYISQNDTINLFESIDRENFILKFMQKEGQDSLALFTGHISGKIFLAGEFLYSYTLNENDEKCDVYKGTGMHFAQKERMGAIFSVQLVPNSLEDFGIEHYVLWIIFEDNSHIHFDFKK